MSQVGTAGDKRGADRTGPEEANAVGSEETEGLETDATELEDGAGG